MYLQVYVYIIMILQTVYVFYQFQIEVIERAVMHACTCVYYQLSLSISLITLLNKPPPAVPVPDIVIISGWVDLCSISISSSLRLWVALLTLAITWPYSINSSNLYYTKDTNDRGCPALLSYLVPLGDSMSILEANEVNSFCFISISEGWGRVDSSNTSHFLPTAICSSAFRMYSTAYKETKIMTREKMELYDKWCTWHVQIRA